MRRETEIADETRELGSKQVDGTHLEAIRTEDHPSSHPHPISPSLDPTTSVGVSHPQPCENSAHDVSLQDHAPPEDDSTTEVLVIQSTRGTRKKRTIAHLADCLCGTRVSTEEIVDGGGIVRCKKSGCETEWVSSSIYRHVSTSGSPDAKSLLQYHLACVGGLELAPRSWMCETCTESSEGSRKKRRKN